GRAILPASALSILGVGRAGKRKDVRNCNKPRLETKRGPGTPRLTVALLPVGRGREVEVVVRWGLEACGLAWHGSRHGRALEAGQKGRTPWPAAARDFGEAATTGGRASFGARAAHLRGNLAEVGERRTGPEAPRHAGCSNL